MKQQINKTLLIIFILIILIFSGFLYYQFQANKNKEINFNSTISLLEEDKQKFLEENNNLKNEINLLKENLLNTEGKLEENQEDFNKLNKDFKIITKVINTDVELLQKYSKIYFLNEHYTPKSLSYIEDDFLTIKDKPQQIHSEIKKYLEEMLEDAEKNEVKIKILSAYRSFGEQASLKYNYKIMYGSGANTFSADQGYSEHQLGTTVDLTSETFGASLTTNFDQTEEFKWLSENAYKYGFVLSYPQNNTYYQYEPWHWRFVSTELAEKLHEEDKYFYDLDQREIYQYLGKFFD